MYRNCCEKCGSMALFTQNKGNNVGLYCASCGAWIKWLNKNEYRAFQHSKKSSVGAPTDELDKFIDRINEELAGSSEALTRDEALRREGYIYAMTCVLGELNKIAKILKKINRERDYK